MAYSIARVIELRQPSLFPCVNVVVKAYISWRSQKRFAHGAVELETCQLRRACPPNDEGGVIQQGGRRVCNADAHPADLTIGIDHHRSSQARFHDKEVESERCAPRPALQDSRMVVNAVR